MKAALCTLFEGPYHYGLGALANSAYRNGWRGVLYAGYRGALPPWARQVRPGEPGSIFDFAPGAAIHFIPLSTSAHLTNYKPDFMLDLWNTVVPETPSLFYFDPDIVLHCRWTFFEEWASYGVALCEDVNSPLSFNHPRRAGWKKYFAQHGVNLKDVTEVYVNGGFVGLSKENKAFLRTWLEVQKVMAVDLGGLDLANIGGMRVVHEMKQSPTYMFNKTDQDALNISVMASSCPASIMGGEAMDFKFGGYVMAHPVGPQKPWSKSFMSATLRGSPPTRADRHYWNVVGDPIPVFGLPRVKLMKALIQCAAFIGRFYTGART